MSLIYENMAWAILRRYAEDCLVIDSQTLIAIYAIGSLPGGYYRPGYSDIDAAIIVKDGSEGVWGDPLTPSKALDNLNRRYEDEYSIPKSFGPCAIQENQLLPPYDPKLELCWEIVRLRLQGKVVYGSFSLEKVPFPTPSDLLRDDQHFEEWWRDEFSKTTPWKAMSVAGCVNTILTHLHRFLAIKRDILELNKYRIVSRYLESNPPFVDRERLDTVERFITGGSISSEEERSLNDYAKSLREKMNIHLGIIV